MQVTDESPMSGFKQRLKTAERLLKIAQGSEQFADCRNLYDFFGIAGTATQDQIKAAMLSRQNADDALAKAFIASRAAIEVLLSKERAEYDNYLMALAVTELRKYFMDHIGADGDLDAGEQKRIIEKGMEAGLAEARIVKMIERWAREYAAKPDDKPGAEPAAAKPELPVEPDAPRLKVIRMKDDYYVYKNVARGDVVTETIVLKNEGSGLLKGRIIPDAEWLVPERYGLIERDEQTLQIRIDTGKIPSYAYEACGAVTIETNGALPYRIPFRIVLKDLKRDIGKFRRTYVPVAAVYAGFIGSFSHLPVLGFLASAILAATVGYFLAGFAVKSVRKLGLNLFMLPAALIKGSAAVAIAIMLLRTAGGLIDSSEELERQAFAAVSPPATEALPAISETQTDNDSIQETVVLAGSVAGVEAKTAGIGDFWRFGFDAQADKTHYSFGCSNYDELHFRIDGREVDSRAGIAAIKAQPNRVTLHFRARDWDFVEKCSRDSHCAGSACPLEITVESGTHAQNVQYLPPAVADAGKKRKRAGTAPKKQRTPKAGSFAPPSREDL